MKVIGVMSGSSLDGIDLAYVDISHLKVDNEAAKNTQKPTLTESLPHIQWTLAEHKSCPLPPDLKVKLQQTSLTTAFELAHTEAAFSRYIAEEVNTFVKEKILTPTLLGVHGHTILHLPHIATSWQLLNGGMVAGLTQLPTICDFRNTDMALGGQGTPMAVLADRDLYPGYDVYINLGGIANISLKTPSTDRAIWRAYDLCACNQLLNHICHKIGLDYDHKGQLAKTGHPNADIMALLESDPYLALPYPKSLDNSYIKAQLIKKLDSAKQSVPDQLRTVIEFIATQIAHHIQAHFDHKDHAKVLITGGGAKNDFLIASVQNKLGDNVKITLPSAEQIDFKEAILIAYAAYLRHQALPNFLPSATGAHTAVIGGGLYLPPIMNLHA